MTHPLDFLIASALEAARDLGATDVELAAFDADPWPAPSESAPQILTAEGWRPLRRPE